MEVRRLFSILHPARLDLVSKVSFLLAVGAIWEAIDFDLVFSELGGGFQYVAVPWVDFLAPYRTLPYLTFGAGAQGTPAPRPQFGPNVQPRQTS